jgi:hypothetical protein
LSYLSCSSFLDLLKCLYLWRHSKLVDIQHGQGERGEREGFWKTKICHGTDFKWRYVHKHIFLLYWVLFVNDNFSKRSKTY